MTFNVTHRHAILLKSGDAFLTSVAKLVLEAKASNSSSINKKLYCFQFWVIVIVVIV